VAISDGGRSAQKKRPTALAIRRQKRISRAAPGGKPALSGHVSVRRGDYRLIYAARATHIVSLDVMFKFEHAGAFARTPSCAVTLDVRALNS
jgi:mRNA-degrading endonuclease RelE of RelBE toxin-antitoxin system